MKYIFAKPNKQTTPYKNPRLMVSFFSQMLFALVFLCIHIRFPVPAPFAPMRCPSPGEVGMGPIYPCCEPATASSDRGGRCYCSDDFSVEVVQLQTATSGGEGSADAGSI